MKAKKAIKRLSKAEALLSGVLDQFSGSEEKVRGLIETARTSVVEAKTGIDKQAAPKAAKKPPASAGETKSRLTNAGRKKISQAAKKRWAAAKRNGVHAATGRPLTKTA
jgi:hypothetical protein